MRITIMVILVVIVMIIVSSSDDSYNASTSNALPATSAP